MKGWRRQGPAPTWGSWVLLGHQAWAGRGPQLFSRGPGRPGGPELRAGSGEGTEMPQSWLPDLSPPSLNASMARSKGPGAGRLDKAVCVETTESAHCGTPPRPPGGFPASGSRVPGPSPVLWGCTWLPQGFFSGVPNLAGVTERCGARFLRRLLLAGVPPWKGPGQHAASGEREGQGRSSVPCPSPPRPPAGPALPLLASLSAGHCPVSPGESRLPAHLAHLTHFTGPRSDANTQCVSGHVACAPLGSRERPLLVGAGLRSPACLRRVALSKGHLEPSCGMEATPFPQCIAFTTFLLRYRD